jgi:ferric-dicitrate binding protein FerR (iron transport regulator)
MTIQRLNYLLSKWEGNALSKEETKELIHWYRSFDGDKGLTETLTPVQKEQLEKWIWGRIHSALNTTTGVPTLAPGQAYAVPTGASQRTPRSLFPMWKWAAAAAVILLISGIGYRFMRAAHHSSEPMPLASAKSQQTDVAPGGNHAILTLGDGKVISLDSVGNGLLSNAAGTSITKQSGEELTYSAQTGSPIVYNTLSTPKGGQYQIILPDGTHVWINAASTLKYPTQFGDKDRTVELVGEAYFEVTKDHNKPFYVTSPTMRVAVLSTTFNISDYPEDTRSATTLLQGAVKIAHGGQEKLLAPGQQASLSRQPNAGGQPNASSLPNESGQPAPNETPDQIKVLDNVDIAEVTAWKNGFFKFDDVDLPTIMRQAARWYDINIVYDGPISQERYRGKISRNVQLSQLLKILELNGVKFELHDKTLTVH